MAEKKNINYEIKDIIELNLSYMPFINQGGLFVPTDEIYPLGDSIILSLTLPGKKDPLIIEGKVVWQTPKNALHHVLPGVGIQFNGENASVNRSEIEKSLDKTMEVGGYVYGVTEEKKG